MSDDTRARAACNCEVYEVCPKCDPQKHAELAQQPPEDTRARAHSNCPLCDARDADAKEWALAWVDKQKECNGLRELCEEMDRVVSFMPPTLRADLLPDWFIPRLQSLLSTETPKPSELVRSMHIVAAYEAVRKGRMRMTDTRARARALLNNITTGGVEWHYDATNMEVQARFADGSFRIVVELDGVDGWVPDGRFIADAPGLVRDLLAEMDAIGQSLREQIEQLQPAASERDSIAALLSDRPEVGTYGKVEGLVARVAQLEQALLEAIEAWEYAAEYKGEHLQNKHGDDDEIARLRAILDKP